MPPDATSRRADWLVRIRRAEPDERDRLEDLQRRASLAWPQYREQLLAHPDAIELPSRQIERGDVFAAEVEGRLVGFAALEGGELDGLFVEPEHWGKGIGSALVEAAAHEARRRGLTLRVIAASEARGFYEKCGFTVEGEAQTRFGPALSMSR
jgi:GNAT superfamily N-acetyltransferase